MQKLNFAKHNKLQSFEIFWLGYCMYLFTVFQVQYLLYGFVKIFLCRLINVLSYRHFKSSHTAVQWLHWQFVNNALLGSFAAIRARWRHALVTALVTCYRHDKRTRPVSEWVTVATRPPATHSIRASPSRRVINRTRYPYPTLHHVDLGDKTYPIIV